MNNTPEGYIKEAAALKYSPGKDSAPKVIAVGKGELAEKLIEKADENNIPVYRNNKLAHTLSMLDLGQEIPFELYEVVAEILVFVGNLDKSYGEIYGNSE
jgi:flagellar biosynthesis protein